MPIGIWWELPPEARWSNEGVSRVIGFLIGGAALRRTYAFHIVVRRGLREVVREDLRQLSAEEGVDWHVHEPSARDEALYLEKARALEPREDVGSVGLALFANARVPVDGWIIPFPHFESSVYLDQSKAVLVPDALPYDFPLGWAGQWEEDGFWPTWRKRAAHVSASADAVINFSHHVAKRHSGPLLNVPDEKIHIVPLAPPDLADELPFVRGRTRSQNSREEAGAILREHAAERGLEYLRNFPFEQCDFIIDATQDRPTKNLGMAADAVERIVRQQRRSLKLFLTATIHFGEEWTRLPGVIETRQFHRDLAVLRDLPRGVHAALFHAAAVTVHASFYEGIIGCLPFYESVSVGTPALFARGPHTDELLADEPSLRPFTFDPYDVPALQRLICETIDAREEVIAIQQKICARLRRLTWAHTADGYVEAALAGRTT